MGSSPVYLMCLVLVCFDKCWRTRCCALFCSLHIIIENIIGWYFSQHIYYFDFSFYLTILWGMDILLITTCMAILSGIRKKLIMFIGAALIVMQLIFLQYPYLNEYISSILISQAYFIFIESFILLSAIKIDSIKEIFRSTSIVFLLISVHLLY